MDKEIIIEYRPTIDTLMKVTKHLLNKLFLVRYIPMVILFIVLLILIPFFKNQNTLEGMSIFNLSNSITFLLIIILWVFIYFNTLAKMKKTILNNKRNFETQKVTFNNNSYIQEGDTFKVTSFWNEAYQIEETKDWFFNLS